MAAVAAAVVLVLLRRGAKDLAATDSGEAQKDEKEKEDKPAVLDMDALRARAAKKNNKAKSVHTTQSFFKD